MTPEELLASRMKIATDLHTQIGSLRSEVQGLRNEMASFGESLNALRGEIRSTLNHIRDRAA
jgi:peptidoglycan hydrolase CwlO-like protein